MQESITDTQIREANRRFDAQYPHFRHYRGRMPSAWKEHRLLMGHRLNDREIARYAAMGYYSSNLKAAREAYQQRKRWFRSL